MPPDFGKLYHIELNGIPLSSRSAAASFGRMCYSTKNPEGLSTQDLRTLVPKATKGMPIVFGTKDFKGYVEPLGKLWGQTRTKQNQFAEEFRSMNPLQRATSPQSFQQSFRKEYTLNHIGILNMI